MIGIFNGAVIDGMIIEIDPRNETQPVVLLHPPAGFTSVSRVAVSATTTAEVYTPPLQDYDYSCIKYSIPRDYVPTYINPAPPYAFNAQIPIHPVDHAIIMPTTNDSVPRLPNVLQIERRRIVIKKLPKAMVEQGVRDLIAGSFQSNTFDPVCIENIELPLDSDGNIRGHALVWMQSHDLAVHVIGRLNGQKCGGRYLEVTLAVEGALVGFRPNGTNLSTRSTSTHTSKQAATPKAHPVRPHTIRRSVTPAIANGSGIPSGS